MNYGPAGLRRLLINQCVFSGEREIYPILTVLIQRTGRWAHVQMCKHKQMSKLDLESIKDFESMWSITCLHYYYRGGVFFGRLKMFTALDH